MEESEEKEGEGDGSVLLSNGEAESFRIAGEGRGEWHSGEDVAAASCSPSPSLSSESDAAFLACDISSTNTFAASPNPIACPPCPSPGLLASSSSCSIGEPSGLIVCCPNFAPANNEGRCRSSC